MQFIDNKVITSMVIGYIGIELRTNVYIKLLIGVCIPAPDMVQITQFSPLVVDNYRNSKHQQQGDECNYASYH